MLQTFFLVNLFQDFQDLRLVVLLKKIFSLKGVFLCSFRIYNIFLLGINLFLTRLDFYIFNYNLRVVSTLKYCRYNNSFIFCIKDSKFEARQMYKKIFLFLKYNLYLTREVLISSGLVSIDDRCIKFLGFLIKQEDNINLKKSILKAQEYKVRSLKRQKHKKNMLIHKRLKPLKTNLKQILIQTLRKKDFGEFSIQKIIQILGDSVFSTRIEAELPLFNNINTLQMLVCKNKKNLMWTTLNAFCTFKEELYKIHVKQKQERKVIKLSSTQNIFCKRQEYFLQVNIPIKLIFQYLRDIGLVNKQGKPYCSLTFSGKSDHFIIL
jgi:hypothetical protein